MSMMSKTTESAKCAMADIPDPSITSVNNYQDPDLEFRNPTIPSFLKPQNPVKLAEAKQLKPVNPTVFEGK